MIQDDTKTPMRQKNSRKGPNLEHGMALYEIKFDIKHFAKVIDEVTPLSVVVCQSQTCVLRSSQKGQMDLTFYEYSSFQKSAWPPPHLILFCSFHNYPLKYSDLQRFCCWIWLLVVTAVA